MTTETKHTILFTLLFAGLATGGYFSYQWAKGNNKNNTNNNSNNTPSSAPAKQDMVAMIVTSSGGAGHFEQLMTLDDMYIASWYNALKNKQVSFSLNGKTFDSVTGKEIA